jgi:hypothetical protein
MADDNHTLFDARKTQLPQLHQRMFSWSRHVRSWLDESGLPLHIVRYEDMFFQPLETFAGVAKFVGELRDSMSILKAIHFSSFDELKKQEQEHGFSEKALQAASFFRKGKVGDWREQLTSSQVEQIVSAHAEAMGRFGYLPL